MTTNTKKTKKAPAADYAIVFRKQYEGVEGLWFMAKAYDSGFLDLHPRAWCPSIEFDDAARLTLSDARLVRDHYSRHECIDADRFLIVKITDFMTIPA